METSASGSIAVVGAAGQTGRRVLASLADRGVSARAVVRDPMRTGAAITVGGHEVAAGDLNDISSLRKAFAGIDVVEVIVGPVLPGETRMVENAIVAAEQAGVRRLVYHSVLQSDAEGVRHHARKARAERALHDSSLAWTVLRPGMYVQSLTNIMARPVPGAVDGSIELRVPFSTSSPFSLIDVDDIGIATARVLTESGHEFATYELAGGPVQTIEGFADELAASWSCDVSLQQVLPAEWSPDAGSHDRDATSRFADMLAMCDHYNRHGLVGSSVTLEALLGRAPTTFAEVAHRVHSERVAGTETVR